MVQRELNVNSVRIVHVNHKPMKRCVSDGSNVVKNRTDSKRFGEEEVLGSDARWVWALKS
jgi:hypothetical protein